MTVPTHLFPSLQSLQSTSTFNFMLFPWPEVGCTALFPLYSGSVVYCEIEKCSVLLFPEGHHIDDPPEIDQRRGPAEIQLQPLDQVNNWLHCRILSVCRWIFLCPDRFFSGFYGFLRSSKTNTFKFQFDHWQQSGRRKTSTTWMYYILIVID